MFKFNNKGARTTSCSSASIVNFEHAIVDPSDILHLHLCPFNKYFHFNAWKVINEIFD